MQMTRMLISDLLTRVVYSKSFPEESPKDEPLWGVVVGGSGVSGKLCMCRCQGVASVLEGPHSSAFPPTCLLKYASCICIYNSAVKK